MDHGDAHSISTQDEHKSVTPPPDEHRSASCTASVAAESEISRHSAALQTAIVASPNQLIPYEQFRNVNDYLDAGFTHAATNPFHDLTFSCGEPTFLHYAARYGCESVLQRVINYLYRLGKSLPQLVDQNGWKAVFHAIYASSERRMSFGCQPGSEIGRETRQKSKSQPYAEMVQASIKYISQSSKRAIPTSPSSMAIFICSRSAPLCLMTNARVSEKVSPLFTNQSPRPRT